MRPRVHYLMDLLVAGGSLALLAYICGGSAIAGILGALLYGVFGVLLVIQLPRILKE